MSYNEVNPVDLRKRKPTSPIVWPKSLQDFTARSFIEAERILDDRDKIRFNKEIQMILERELQAGTVFTIDWDKVEVPILKQVRLDYASQQRNERKRPRDQDFGSLPLEQRLAQTNYDGNSEYSSFGQSAVGSVTGQSFVSPSNTGYIAPLNPSVLNDDFASRSKKRQRAERFESSTPRQSSPSSSNPSSTVIGTSTSLEKNYLRLTTEPNPIYVRPYERLKLSMNYVLSKYDSSKNYSYIINQFKSIRQDLTVQHIKGDFTINVYETNGRISLENNDLGEFNQCQSQLKVLYYQQRRESKQLKFIGSEVEFLIYRLIYMIMTSNLGEIYKLKLTLATKYKDFIRTPREDHLFEFINRLFELNDSILSINYIDFFKIIQFNIDLPLAFQLINNYITNKLRVKALGTISKSYRTITAEFIIDQLKFANIVNFVKFLTEYGLFNFLIKDATEFDCLNARHTIKAIVEGAAFKKVDIKGQI